MFENVVLTFYNSGRSIYKDSIFILADPSKCGWYALHVKNKVELKCTSFAGKPVGNFKKILQFFQIVLLYIANNKVQCNFVGNLRSGMETISTGEAASAG